MPQLITEKTLAQRRPLSTTATTLYKPPTDCRAKIKTLVVCNTTSSAATYRLFLDQNGSTMSTDTALIYDMNIPANSTFITCFDKDGGLCLDSSSATLGIRSSVAGAINFTVSGQEIKES